MGTLMNVAFIIVGGLVGILLGNRLDKRIQDTVMMGNAVAILFVGISGALSKMLVITEKSGHFSLGTKGILMMIVSIAAGAVVGEFLQIEERITHFGEWLKHKSGNSKDGTFVTSFVTASLTVCIGAMAVVGSIEDGITGNYTVLLTKGILDFVIILVMTSSLGKGALFSFIPVGIFQGTITVLAKVISPYITDSALNNLSYVGSILIFCVGINLIWGSKIKVANLLPAIFIAAGIAYF